MMVKESPKFRESFSALSTPGDEKEKYDKVGKITKYRCLQRQKSSRAQWNCATAIKTMVKKNHLRVKRFGIEQKGKASSMDIKTNEVCKAPFVWVSTRKNQL